MIGWEKRSQNVTVPVPPASGIKSGWVTVAAWTRADAEALKLTGPATLYGHVGAELGDTSQPGDVLLSFPKEIKTQWLRASADGLTQRVSHVVGEARQWAGASSGPEYLTLDDFAFRLQVWQRGGVMVVTKVITVIDAPDSRLGWRLLP